MKFQVSLLFLPLKYYNIMKFQDIQVFYSTVMILFNLDFNKTMINFFFWILPLLVSWIYIWLL